jgi:GT2 family glycosyltransferase
MIITRTIVNTLNIKHIAVLLTCHNRRDKTIECLTALFNNILPENILMNVYLVDDGSIDGTSAAVSIKFPDVNLILGSGNLFWNRGMYLAWETATKRKNYDFYLWLNDDTLLIRDALSIMLEYSETVKNERIIVGATCSASEKMVSYSGFNSNDEILVPDGNWQNCAYFNGNIVLIPNFVFNKVGFLDKQFRHAIGDIDYGLRALKMGFIHCLSPIFLGYCENHESYPVWCNPAFPLYKRLKNLYTPLGNNTIEFFIFDRRHNGLFKAVFHFFTIHIRTIFPSIWRKRVI